MHLSSYARPYSGSSIEISVSVEHYTRFRVDVGSARLSTGIGAVRRCIVRPLIYCCQDVKIKNIWVPVPSPSHQPRKICSALPARTHVFLQRV